MSMSHVMANESMSSIAPLCFPAIVVALASVVLASIICKIEKHMKFKEFLSRIDGVAPAASLEEINAVMELVMESLNSK